MGERHVIQGGSRMHQCVSPVEGNLCYTPHETGWRFQGFFLYRWEKGHRARTRAIFWSGNAIWWSCIIYRNQLRRHPPCCCAFCATHTNTAMINVQMAQRGEGGGWMGRGKKINVYSFLLSHLSLSSVHIAQRTGLASFFISRHSLFLAVREACWSTDMCGMTDGVIIFRKGVDFSRVLMLITYMLIQSTFIL